MNTGQEYDVGYDVDNDKILGNLIIDVIESGDLEALSEIVETNPGLSLSKLPGFHKKKFYTPIAIAALQKRKNIFEFLLEFGVDLEVEFELEIVTKRVPINTNLSRNRPGLTTRANLLSSLVTSLVAYDNTSWDLVEMLLSHPIQICIPNFNLRAQPLVLIVQNIIQLKSKFYRPFEIERVESLLIEMIGIQLQKNDKWGANMMINIFCSPDVLPTTSRLRHYLAKAMLKLIQLGIHFNREHYNAYNLPDDASSRIIDQLLTNDERNRTLHAIHANQATFLSQLPDDIFLKLLERVQPEHDIYDILR